MKNKISSYKDLLQEEQRLIQLKQVQGNIVQLDYQQWKDKLSPVNNVLGILKKMSIPAANNSLLSKPLKVMVRVLTRLLLPKNSGLLTRWLVPLAIRNYSSYKFNRWGDQLLEKVKDWRTSRKHKKDKRKSE
jgi:hypothetical protein